MPSDIWDWRRFQPLMPPMGIPGAVPSVTTPFPPPAAPVPPGPPVVPPEPGRLPSLPMFRGLPMGPQTKEAVITPPPSVPATGPATSPIPLVGPGASTPAITGAPTRPVMPGTEFGNPATREAIRTTAPGAPTKGPYDDIYEKAARGDFNGAIAGLSKAMGNRRGIDAPTIHREALRPGSPGAHEVNTQGYMDQIMANLPSVAAQKKLLEQQKRRRREQNRYDILGGQG